MAWLRNACRNKEASKTDFPFTYSNVILSGLYTDLSLRRKFNLIDDIDIDSDIEGGTSAEGV